MNEPAPAGAGTTQTYTFNTGVAGLSASNLRLKASGAAPASCTLAPTFIGPYTNGQVVSQTFTPSGCATSTCSIIAGSLRGSGLSLGGASNCVLSGTAVTGSYSFTVAYGAASNTINLSVSGGSRGPTSGSGFTGRMSVSGGRR